MEGKRYSLLFFLIGAIAAVSYTHADTPQQFDPQEIIHTVETLYMGKTSYSMMYMKVITDTWTRELTMEAWSEGRDKFLATIISPKKEQGTATLKIGDEMWNYLPKIDRLMKIPSSLMGDRWMGSHLTNDDLVKETKIDELYTFEMVKIEESIATIKCIPKPDAAIVWDLVIYRIDIAKTIPVSVDYYDEDGELVRKSTFDMVEEISGRWIPMRMRIQPVENPDEMTELLYENLEFDVKLPENLFSFRSLRRR